MSQMTLKIKKVGMKNPKTKVLGFASRAIANGTQEFSEVCELAGLNTTMNQAELEAAGKLIMQAAVRQLKDGKAVNLGPLGKIRPAVSGKWVEKAEDLALSDLTPKLNYVPSDELKAAISGANIESCWAYHFKIWPTGKKSRENIDRHISKLIIKQESK